MKVETKAEKNPCVVKLSVSAEAAEIAGEEKKTFGTFLREAVIPGFRKGKVPAELIRAKFDKEIEQETTNALLRALYPKALEEAKLEPIVLENVTDAKWTKGESFTFEALVEVPPQFKLPKYKGLAIKKGDATVKDEQVDAVLAEMRKQYASYEDARDGDVVADGDFVSFDYAATLDDKPLAEILPDQAMITGKEGHWLRVEEGNFLPEILKALKGLKIGDTKEKVTVKFPKDNAPEAIAGKKVSYSLTVKALRKAALPDDAKLAEQMKAESFDALRAKTRENLEKRATQQELGARRDQAIDLLLKKTDFDVPPVFVQRQMNAYLEQLARQAQYMGMTAEYIEQNREKMLADANDRAEKQVRLSYILAEIAKVEKITVDEKDANKIEGAKAEKALDFILAEAK